MKKQSTNLLDHNGNFQLSFLIKSRKLAWLTALAIGFLAMFATVGLLVLSGWFITAAALAGILSITTAYTFNFLIPSAFIRLFAIVRTAGRYGERMASHNAVLGLLSDLRSISFSKLLHQKKHQYRSPETMHRLITDIDRLNNWPLAVVLPWVWAITLLIFYLIFLFIIAPSLLLWVLPSLLCAGLLIPVIAIRKAKQYAEQEIQNDESRRSQLLNSLPMITHLIQWQQWPRFSQSFIKSSKVCDDNKYRQQQFINIIALIQEGLMLLSIGVLMISAIPLLSEQTLSPALLLALILGIFGLNEGILALGIKSSAAGLSICARDRINALLTDSENSQQQNESKINTLNMPITMDIRQLSVKYPHAVNGAMDINLTLQSGDILIINGRSGAGKSTLLMALAGELPINQGQYFLNNKPYQEYDLTTLIGFLSQDITIFDLTLAENLRLAGEYLSDQQLWDMLEKVDLKSWAEQQPLQLNTPLGEYGVAISGGQARRIALARILIMQRPILILDEPFAGLDQTSHFNILNMLQKEMQQGILIIVSHLDDKYPNAKHYTLNG